MPRREFQHPIPEHGFREQADDYLQHLVSFHNVVEHALDRGAVELVGDFAPIAMGLAYLSWLHGHPARDVAERAGDAVAIAASATAGGYVFKSPYDYWLLSCWAVALDHPAAEDLLALPPEQWARTARTKVVGILPLAVEALAMLASGGIARESVGRLQAFHRQALGDAEEGEEALRFAPTVGALVAIQTSNATIWSASCHAREDGWKREAWLYPTANMFLLDVEWLAMMRLARDAGLPLPKDDVYRPHALLGAGEGDPGTLGDRLGPIGLPFGG